MENLKNNLKTMLVYAKKADFAIVFITITLIMLLTGYAPFLTVTAAYIYSAFYVLIKKVITGQGVSFLHLFLLFIVGVLVISGGAYGLTLIFNKGA